MDIKEAIKLKYTVIGAGRSGIAITKFLKSKGISVFLSEKMKSEELLYFSENEFKNLNIEFELGEHSDKVFDADILIVSPGVSLNSEFILKAVSLGKKVYGEIEVASWFCKSPIIAITGTNGKTTTTALTGEIFKNAGFDTKVCGNIGHPFAEVLDKLKDDSIVVLEVSSFQLSTIESFAPKVAAILNITADHLDWHGSLENYIDAKFIINRNQTDKDYFIYNFDDSILRQQVSLREIKGKLCAFGSSEKIHKANLENVCYLTDNFIRYIDNNKIDTEIINVKEIYIPGKHNIYNSMAAVLSAKCFNINNEIISDTLKKFKGVEHRIEFVKEVNGVKYYNDSKSTNFDSLYVALESFPKDVILIMGGKKGDNKFEMVKEFISNRVITILAIGQSKEDIYNYYRNTVEVIKCETLQEAVSKASNIAKSGNVVLFSPGYKSFDMFNNYEHRGNEFKKSVYKL